MPEYGGSRYSGDIDDGMTEVVVSHTWMKGSQEVLSCGHAHPDPGLVMVSMSHLDEEGITIPGGCLIGLSAEQALLLAELIRKAAGWLIDESCDVPDIEREAARFSRTRS